VSAHDLTTHLMIRTECSTCFPSQQLAQRHPSEITVLNRYAFFWPLWFVFLSPLSPFPATNFPILNVRHDDHLRLVHRSLSYSFHSPPSLSSSPSSLLSGGQFAYHLWESFAYERYLSPYDPDRIHNLGAKTGNEREEDGASDENSFSREARRWVGEAFRERWRKAKRAGLVDT